MGGCRRCPGGRRPRVDGRKRPGHRPSPVTRAGMPGAESGHPHDLRGRPYRDSGRTDLESLRVAKETLWLAGVVGCVAGRGWGISGRGHIGCRLGVPVWSAAGPFSPTVAILSRSAAGQAVAWVTTTSAFPGVRPAGTQGDTGVRPQCIVAVNSPDRPWTSVRQSLALVPGSSGPSGQKAGVNHDGGVGQREPLHSDGHGRWPRLRRASL